MKPRPAALRAALTTLTAAAILASVLTTGPTAATAAEVPQPQTAAAAPTTADLSGDMIAVPPAVSTPSPRRSTGATTQSESTQSESVQSESAQSQSAQAASTVSVEKIYVSRAAATTTTADDSSSLKLDDASIKAAVSSLHDYWWEQSSHTVDIQLAGIENDSLAQKTCDANTTLNGVSAKAFGGSFANFSWINTHRHLLVLSREACGTVAFGTLGGNGGLIFSGYGTEQSLAVPILLHEFGHNLGFQHANAGFCRSAKVFDGTDDDFSLVPANTTTSVQCPVREYGDYADIMGYSLNGARPGLSSLQRSLAGYITDVTDDSAVGTRSFTIKPLSGSASGRSLRIVDPVSKAVYYVEYRTKTGADASNAEFAGYRQNCESITGGFTLCALGSSATSGSVRILRTLPNSNDSRTYPATVVLAAGLDSKNDPTRRDTHLDKGESFTDYGSGLSLKVTSLNPSSGAVVSVRLGTAPTFSAKKPATAATTTTLKVNRATQAYGSSTRITATATVSAREGGIPNGTLTLKRGGTTVSKGAVPKNGAVAYTLPKTLAAGSYALKATYAPTSEAFAASTSSTVKVAVTKAKSTTRSSLSHTKIARSGTPLVAVAVSAPGVTAPTGTVTVSANGKVVKRYSLTSAKKGRVTLSLPKFATAKKYTITTSFSGSTSTASSKASAGTLTVTK
ncbi:Ig-like domain-containing protein [Frondihabitans sp. Leaf304]|uniref:Ig-like domain-containing protein n=1 Tax=Frondihabitans sp. Leaf304 TaxID=1736329 RepID=UPI0006F24B78|nr:Ig-like domain-containing protein [Frondihabitans sp. Leaf304]KQQ28126.1 hypothetical protein ASF54_05315 [Frondihabitans sp. Leaf304]